MPSMDTTTRFRSVVDPKSKTPILPVNGIRLVFGSLIKLARSMGCVDDIMRELWALDASMASGLTKGAPPTAAASNRRVWFDCSGCGERRHASATAQAHADRFGTQVSRCWECHLAIKEKRAARQAVGRASPPDVAMEAKVAPDGDGTGLGPAAAKAPVDNAAPECAPTVVLTVAPTMPASDETMTPHPSAGGGASPPVSATVPELEGGTVVSPGAGSAAASARK